MTDRLKERLRAFDDVDMGGACEVTVYRNPDGPEALARITQLEAEVERLTECRRLMGEVIDYACWLPNIDQGMGFIEAYREGRHTDDAGFALFQQVQRAALHQGDRKP